MCGYYVGLARHTRHAGGGAGGTRPCIRAVSLACDDHVTDAAAAALGRHLRLEDVSVIGCTQLTDAALAQLASPSLARINYQGCHRISKEAYRLLTAQNPSVQSYSLARAFGKLSGLPEPM